jgi:UDP-GlcNAc:undecaprenyl-phosphate GlcNAc-1-phosphate transferase
MGILRGEMLEVLICFSLSSGFGFLFTEAARWFGLKIGVIDYPNHRKIHKEPIPCSGGLGVSLSFFAPLFILSIIHYKVKIFEILKLSALSFLFLLLGLYDDKKDTPPHIKLLTQALLCLIAIILGLRIELLSNPFGGVFHLGSLSIPLTLLWFLGFINVINLIDGLDGLASGIVAITSFVLVVSGLISGDIYLSTLSASLLGATISFLKANISRKEKIFLGDNGSMLLGFLLASIGIIGSHKGAVPSALLITLLCLGVPIYDTATSIIRRRNRGSSIFHADKDHIHHQLLRNGFSERGALFLLYTITFALGMISLLVTSLHNAMATAILLVSGIIVIVIGRKWWMERKRLQNKCNEYFEQS